MNHQWVLRAGGKIISKAILGMILGHFIITIEANQIYIHNSKHKHMVISQQTNKWPLTFNIHPKQITEHSNANKRYRGLINVPGNPFLCWIFEASNSLFHILWVLCSKILLKRSWKHLSLSLQLLQYFLWRIWRKIWRIWRQNMEEHLNSFCDTSFYNEWKHK